MLFRKTILPVRTTKCEIIMMIWIEKKREKRKNQNLGSFLIYVLYKKERRARRAWNTTRWIFLPTYFSNKIIIFFCTHKFIRLKNIPLDIRIQPIDHITIKELENCRILYYTYHIKNEQSYNIAYTYICICNVY